MKLGLLWYDNDPRKPLDLKVNEAVQRYREKFGAEPTICYINPSHLSSKKPMLGKMRVVSAAQVLPNHFWLEIEEKQ